MCFRNMKLIRLIKTYLNEIHTTVRNGQHSSDDIPNGPNARHNLGYLVLKFRLECNVRRSKKIGNVGTGLR